MTWILVKEVAAREIRTRSRTKAFRVITGILVAAAIIGPIVAAVWPEGGDDDLRQVTVGLVDVDEATQQQILAFSEDSLDVKFRDLSDFSANQVDQALTDGDISVALEPGPTLVWNSETDFEVAGVLYAALQLEDVLIKGRDLGLSEGDTAKLLAPTAVQERFADKADEFASAGRTPAARGTVAFFGLMVADHVERG